MNLLLLKAVAGGGNPGALVIFISMIQFEMGDLIWILVGLLLGLAILTGVLCLPRSKPEREQPTDTIGAILVHSETAELLLVRYDLSGRMTFISQGVHAILGYNPEEFTSGKLQIRSFVDLADLQVLESAEAARREGNTQDLQYQYRIRRQDGRWHWMHERQEAIRDESGKIVGFETLAIDFTDRIRFEKQQRRLRELQRLLTSVLEGLVEWEDSPTDLGSTLELLVRYLPLTGASILSIDENQASAQEVASATRRSGKPRPGMPLDGEAAAWWIRSISGAVSLVIHRGRLSEIEPRIRDAIAAEVDGSVVSIPLFIDGELRYALILQGSNDNQSLEPEETSVVQAIVHAISRRLENAEIRREREEFRELRANIERSEAIAHFVSGILHDFNNLIFAVSGRISLMLRKIDDPAICGSLEEIRASIVDAGGIVKRLQHAERLGLDEPDIIDPCFEMSEIIKTSQRLLPKRIRFESDINPLPSGARRNMIRAVPQALQQLVLNLMVNSRDAVGIHGRIRITSGPSPDNQYFELRVDDDGPGIPRKTSVRRYSSRTCPQSLLEKVRGLDCPSAVVWSAMQRARLYWRIPRWAVCGQLLASGLLKELPMLKRRVWNPMGRSKE